VQNYSLSIYYMPWHFLGTEDRVVSEAKKKKNPTLMEWIFEFVRTLDAINLNILRWTNWGPEKVLEVTQGLIISW